MATLKKEMQSALAGILSEVKNIPHIKINKIFYSIDHHELGHLKPPANLQELQEKSLW